MLRFLLCAILLCVVGCSRTPSPPAAIVLVVSDGTSQELLTAARIYAHGMDGHLALESMGRSAIVRTHSLEDAVTDSSAAATAMARGVKAENMAVGMTSPDSTTVVPSILDIARKAGWSTGVVTDDSVTGATPASFLVEHKVRWEDAQIASKILGVLGPRADIVLGGGRKWFAEATEPDAYGAPEQVAVVRETQKKREGSGIAFFSEWPAFADALANGKLSGPVLGTFHSVEFPFYADGPRAPRIADMGVAAVRFLRAKGRPFFLMVEAGLPDKASHRGQAKRAVTEVLELDHLIEELRRNLPDRSLILVTTDHNTGGLSINGPPVSPRVRGDILLGKNPSTGSSILTWATGPGGDLAHSNLREETVHDDRGSHSVSVSKQVSDPDYQQPAAVAAKSALHTGGDVWLLGEGPGSESVNGYLDNTDIFRLITSQIQLSTK